MKKLITGRHKTQLRIHSITITKWGELLHNQQPFWLDVEFYYEPELRFTEDEPGCPEYLEIISAKFSQDVYFICDDAFQGVAKGEDLLTYITGTQYDDLVTMLIMQSKGDCDD